MVSYLRRSLPVAVAIALGASPLTNAQEAGSEADSSSFSSLDEIIVTGTRIKRSNAQSAIPLQILGTEELEDIGTVDLQEALIQLPGVSESISPGNSNNSIQNSGLATINLRRLGDDRTLVLINGKRAVSNSGNSDRVSLSTIPVGFVERTEVTTGGASAIYGSDAVAGVANFLLENDYDGIELDGRYSAPTASGGEESRLNFRWGNRFAEDRGYFLFAASHRDREEIAADATRLKSIRAVEFDDPSTSSSNTFANEIGTPGCDPNNEDRHCFLPSFSGSTPGGVFEGGDAWFVNGRWFNDQSLQPSDRSGSQDFYSDFDGWDFRPDRTLSGEREILNVAMTGSYEFSNNLESSITLMYSDIDYKTRTGFETLNDDDSFGPLEVFEVGNISSSHPFIPAEVEETRSGSVSFDRRLIELGEQARINSRETTRLIADLKGQLGGGYDWEAYFTYGKFDQEQTNPGEVNFLNAQFALDVEADGAGGFQCADAGARSNGCVPLNLFGEGSISQAAADYIRYDGFATQQREQLSAGMFISGDWFEAPGGPVKFAAGAEFRQEDQDTRGDPDGDLIGGIDGDPTTNDVLVTSLATFPSVKSDYKVFEVFGEVDIPLSEQLNLQSAVRVGDYDTVGTIASANLGVVWQITDELRFRSQISRSQRAPNLTELFSPARPDSDDLRDPCDGLQPDGSGLSQPDGAGGENANLDIIRANCLSEPGIQAFFADPDNAGEAFEFDGGVNGPNAGNLNLEEETADTFTAGFVWQPRAFGDFSLIADYYSIEVEDAITSISTQDTVDLCYSAQDFPNNRFCDVVTRNPFGGDVVEVINFQENLNEEKVSGVDLTALYNIEFEAIPGDFDFDFRYSRYFDQEVTFTGIGGTLLVDDNLGQIGNGENEWRARMRYRNGGFRVSYTVLYESGGTDDLLNDPDPSDDRFFDIPGQDFHRLSLSYNFERDDVQYRIYGGVNNVFDDLGPILPTGLDAGSSRNITSGLNDIPGREVFLGLRVRF